MNRRSSALLATVVLLPALGLSGCGGGEEQKGAAKAPATSGASGTPTPAGRVKVGAALPADFPKDDVPLLDSAIAAASTGEPGSGYRWSVVMQPDGDVEDLTAKAGDLLDEAGFEAGAKTDAGRLQVRQYADAAYSVSLTVVGTEDGTSVTYLVSPK